MIPAAPCPALPPSTGAEVAAVRAMESAMAEMEQAPIHTHHLVHAGMYARTIKMPAGCCLTGALIKIPTMLIVNGRCTVTTGGKLVELYGYKILAGFAGRKVAFYAHEETDLTMLFPTASRAVAEIEAEFTDETELLHPWDDEQANTITVTGV